MALDKQSVSFNFQQGIDTFGDPNQLPMGKFVSLQNGIFVADESYAKLQKRNGYGLLTTLPDTTTTYLSTFGTGLVGVGNSGIRTYSQPTNAWYTSGLMHNLQISVVPVIRNSVNQFAVDAAVSANGLVCATFIENSLVGSASAQATAKVIVTDLNSGQVVLPSTPIVSSYGSTSATRMSRVFSIGSMFAVVYEASVSSGISHLEMVHLSQTSQPSISSVTTITTNYSPQTSGSASSYSAFDGIVSSNALFLAWYSIASSGLLATKYDPAFNQGAVARVGSTSYVTMVSVAADNTASSATVYYSYSSLWNGSSVLTFDQQMVNVSMTDYNFNLFPGTNNPFTNQFIANMGSVAGDGSLRLLVEKRTTATAAFPVVLSHVSHALMGPSSGAAVSEYLANSVGMGSKPFLLGSQVAFMGATNSTYQSTYFLFKGVGSSSFLLGDPNGTKASSIVIGKLAYGNGGGWLGNGIPQTNVIGSSAFISYLIKDSLQSVSKATNVSSSTQTVGFYSNTGINVAKFNFTNQSIFSIETGSNLHINGGQLWHFDGSGIDELNFHLFPDNIVVSTASSGGSLATQSYFYVACYEYTDNKGNIFRSAPSIPVNVNTVGAGNSINTITINTYPISARQPNIVQTVLYRWSTAQQAYYKVASSQNPIAAPFAQVPLSTLPGSYVSQTVTISDPFSDAQILGNTALYTNGGVVEDIAPPACSGLAMFDARLWLIDAEDPNLLWFSKQVIENTPVEMSDLFTLFVPPNTSTGIPTGPMTSIAPMDDKLIIFKANTIYYINGTGPDNTGANNQYSQPILVSSGIGCANQNSIVLTPMGIMFQSNKGIWIVKRDMSVEYIGKEAEHYNSATVMAAYLVPGTNHVRFTLNNGLALVYDYLVGQWGIFTTNGISACLYGGLHTYLDGSGNVLQETPNAYVENATPVVLQFQTGFINLAGLQGYQRAYRAYLLGQYLSPHRYTLGVAYDYNSSVIQTATISPDNTTGSGSSVEQWQVNFKQQQCQSFQLTFQEISSGTAGAGLTMSGVNLVYGMKKGYPRNLPAKYKTG